MVNEFYDICRMSVLYVDDDQDISKMVGTWFARNYANQMFIHASDGSEAIQVVEVSKPDIVIIDLNMPQINGLQLLKHISCLDEREMAAISVCKDEDKIIECLLSGYNYFIHKPINFDIFFNCIDCMMEKVFLRRLHRVRELQHLCRPPYRHTDVIGSKGR